MPCARSAGCGARRDDWHADLHRRGRGARRHARAGAELGIGDHVEFAGWRYDDDIRSILSTADVCLAPDPPSPLNDVSTMIKIPEYMAMGRPIVSYDLHESRVSAGDAAAVRRRAATPRRSAACVAELLDDPERRARMGAAGRERVERELSWQHSEQALLAAYDRALGREHVRRREARPRGRGAAGAAAALAADAVVTDRVDPETGAEDARQQQRPHRGGRGRHPLDRRRAGPGGGAAVLLAGRAGAADPTGRVRLLRDRAVHAGALDRR